MGLRGATFTLAPMQEDVLYQLALSLVPHIGPVQARILVEHFGCAKPVFTSTSSRLQSIEGIGAFRANCIRKFKDFARAEEEIYFIRKNEIRIISIIDEDYPRRLLNCYDAPALLFYKGSIDLNASRIIAVIGTRHHTEYGRQLAEKLVQELASYQVCIVSGLAYGIDAIAHKAALQNGLSTIGVLAHGLDQIYPPDHGQLAKDIIVQGGLLTEFPSNTMPDRHNFPIRNRIVAGMCDATVVIETGIKGGSMITAELANNYNRDVFAFPGRVNDSKSMGCHQLIRQNKSALITSVQDLAESMGWHQQPKSQAPKQREIFIELNPAESAIVEILKTKDAVHIDELNFKAALGNSIVAASLLNLEMQNVIVSLPGKMYRLL